MLVRRLIGLGLLGCIAVLNPSAQVLAQAEGDGTSSDAVQQSDSTASVPQIREPSKKLSLIPHVATDTRGYFHLLPLEEEQESGNAVPVLLRMVYEQQTWMKEVFPRLHEYAEMDTTDPRLQELYFDSFARQAMRAGSMSYADWEYPLRSAHPYLILLPDLQSQRQLIGRGMTAWVKQQLAKGEVGPALDGIQAQLACGRHCASTPILVCHLVGLAIVNSALDNLELALQYETCPNLYWSLAALPPTLQELGPMVRWELWATPARLDEPLPPVGDKEWREIAGRFIELHLEASDDRYTVDEGAQLQRALQELAEQQLPESLGFGNSEIEQMAADELIMRWVYLQYCRLRPQIEPLAFASPREVISAKSKIDAEHRALLAATGAKSSPYPTNLPQGILACRNFERRVKFLQTIEALRDYAGKHGGRFPKALADLELAAPNDPFTEMPFEYALEGSTARLRQAEIAGYVSTRHDYELTIKEVD